MPKTTNTVGKTKKWLTVASLVSGSLGTIMAPLLVMYIEYAPQIRTARGEAKASYETMLPAVVELQLITGKSQAQVADLIDDIKHYIAVQRDIDRRVMRCEIYMETLGRRRNLPKPPPYAEEPKLISVDEEVSQTPPEVPQYKLPSKMSGAKKRAQKRAELDCAPSDPLCGL